MLMYLLNKKNPAIAAEMKDTSVAPNNNFKPKRATVSPFCH